MQGVNMNQYMANLALLLSLHFSIYALPSDRLKTLYFEADKVTYDNSRHRGTYTGHVKLKQGTSHLNASYAVTLSNKDNQLKKAIAKGAQNEKAHFWTKTDSAKPMLHAYANKIIYYPFLRQIRLIGQAKIVQGDNRYIADNIQYDMDNSRIISKQNSRSRTTIILSNQTKLS